MNTQQKSLRQLFFPIYLELLFAMLAGTVDTLMLSTVGDQAVGAVGTAHTYISIFIIMFTVISSGMTAVMTQYIGAGQPGVARKALGLGLLLNATIGISLSVFLYLGAEWLLITLGIAAQLLEPARTYLQIVGAFCVCNALIPIFSSYLRSFGHTSPTMVATVVSNIANLVLNAVFLFVFHWGVWGVAMATGLSRLVNLIWLIIASARRIHNKKEDHLPSNRTILTQIIHIGLPAAMESFLYNVSMTLILRFLNQMDETGMQVTARSYAIQIACLSFCAGNALSQANSILVGWRIGRGDLEACVKGTHKATQVGVVITVIISLLFAIFSRQIVGLFSPDPEMVRLVGILLWIDVILEIGRVSNLVYGAALKTSGDAVFPMTIGIFFMFLCAAGGTWFLGVKMGWLVIGAFIAMAADECIRAVLMLQRWRSGKWMNKGFISR